MSVSRTRCEGSMQVPLDAWTIEGRLRTSDLHAGAYWGTCVLCGKRHYDIPFDKGAYGRTVSVWLPNNVLDVISSEAKRCGVSRSKVVVRLIQEKKT